MSAVVGMNVGDYYPVDRRAFIRLHEKGGKHHELPAHHNAAEYLDGYVMAAGIGDDRHGPLFRTFSGKTGRLTENRMTRSDVLRTIKTRAIKAGIAADRICCHTCRATGITAYLENGGTLEHAQAIAAHESPRTTKLYDRTADAITLDEIERIAI
ncbi:MAG TPA: tyrosine-type recombinase/integrase [Lacipirellulaceae bacterium]|nr:tyrosine-type recombinase/integrase [Lacipirellulaceae bacterium]